VLITNLSLLDGFLARNAAARAPLRRWVEIVEQAEWQNIMHVRRDLPHADAIKRTNLTCFNIGGNSFRLLTIVRYDRQEVFVVELLAHAQYTKKYA
jgi:mRNA interferase HigB